MSSKDDALKFFRYDREAGVLYWTVHRGKGRKGEPAGTMVRDRLVIRCSGLREYVHRIIWRLETGRWPEMVIDHIDGNPLNNHFSNLREVTASVNSQNMRKAHRDSSTGFLGVFRSKKKFAAQIHADGVTFHLGSFAGGGARRLCASQA